jgi:hypothetical protein
LVEQLFAVGNNGVIGAEPKVGKSWIGLLLAFCVASGISFLGFPVPEARRVLYIQEEDGWRRVSTRLRRLIKGAGAENPGDENLRVVIRKGFRIDLADLRAALVRELEEFHPALVVVDVFNSIHEKDEQSQKEISEVLRHFTALNREYACAFIILHHFRKANGRGSSSRGGQNLRGSSTFHGWVENSLYLTWTAAKSFNVEVESKDFDCDPFAVTITDTADGGVTLETHPLGVAGSGASEKDWLAVEVLFATQNTIPALDASRAIGRNKTTAAARLKAWTEQERLYEEHLATGGPHGTFLYRLAAKGDEPREKNSKKRKGA